MTTQETTVLLVVDVQVGVMASAWDAARIESNIATVVAKARSAHVPIIWVQHSDDGLKYGSDAWQIVPSLAPAATEPVVHKSHNSSFADTDLEQKLRELGTKRVVLAGASTNWCIRATAFSALERGYDLTLVSDGHTTESLEFSDGKIIPAESIVAEFTVGMKWISVPRVKVEVTKAEDLAF